MPYCHNSTKRKKAQDFTLKEKSNSDLDDEKNEYNNIDFIKHKTDKLLEKPAYRKNCWSAFKLKDSFILKYS